MRAISHRRVNSPQTQELSNLPGNNFNLGLEMHETSWRIPSGNTSGCAGLAVSFYRSSNSLLTTTCRSLFSISVCCCGYDPVTPGPLCSPPHLCKPQRQCRASQSRCWTPCCPLLLQTLRKTCPFSPGHGAVGHGLHGAVGLGMGEPPASTPPCNAFPLLCPD